MKHKSPLRCVGGIEAATKHRLQESELSAERLREILEYDPLSGVFTWKVRMSRNSRHRVGDVAGMDAGRGYIRIGIGYRLFAAHRLAWLYVYGKWPTYQIDHINQVKGDNRIANLREANSFENCQNVGPTSRNTTGHRGVSLVGGRWRAMLHHKGKQHFLGLHDHIEDAVEAYAVAAAKYHTHNPAALPA